MVHTCLLLILALNLLAASLAARAAVPVTNAAAQGQIEALRRHVLRREINVPVRGWTPKPTASWATPLLASHDINEKDADGWTTLMRAADAGEAGAVRFLLEEGALAYPPTEWNTPWQRRPRTALGLAKRRLHVLLKKRESKGRSWKDQHPQHLDSKLNDLSECISLLKKAAGSFESWKEQMLLPTLQSWKKHAAGRKLRVAATTVAGVLAMWWGSRPVLHAA